MGQASRGPVKTLVCEIRTFASTRIASAPPATATHVASAVVTEARLPYEAPTTMATASSAIRATSSMVASGISDQASESALQPTNALIAAKAGQAERGMRTTAPTAARPARPRATPSPGAPAYATPVKQAKATTIVASLVRTRMILYHFGRRLTYELGDGALEVLAQESIAWDRRVGGRDAVVAGHIVHLEPVPRHQRQ